MQENIGNGIFIPSGVIKDRIPRPLTRDEKARIKAEGRIQQSLGDLFPTVPEATDGKTGSNRTPKTPAHNTSAWAKPAGSLGTPAHFGQGVSAPRYGNSKRERGNGKKK